MEQKEIEMDAIDDVIVDVPKSTNSGGYYEDLDYYVRSTLDVEN